MKLNSPKQRLLSKAYEEIKEGMSISHMLKSLRATEYILKEKLDISDKEWKIKFEKYGHYYVSEIKAEPL